MPANYLQPTAYIDSTHPQIIATAAYLTRDKSSDRAKAVAIFEFVRDRVRFGFATGFYDQKASEVLGAAIGYCNTKSTLFVALLRAAGIPARQVFVDIDARVLKGLLDPGTPYVDHSYSEVWLDGRWIATDAYIVDAPMFIAAQHRLQAEGGVLGYGVHSKGTIQWTGMAPAFSQFNDDGALQLNTRAPTPYADVGAYYELEPLAWNRLNWVMRQAFGVLAASANATAEGLRQNGLKTIP
jgi:hypothetical protein